MKRRYFIKGTSLSVVAISATGFVRLEGDKFVGDCQTTTDILGPFYRPNAPLRSNLVIENLPGEIVTLKGIVRHDDCETVLPDCKIELWHCSADEVYDNESDAYNYRGIGFSDAQGTYRFTTQMPVPYDAGGGMYRPAHFHLMMSAPGYQTLVTQLYFSGDKYLQNDRSSKSARAQQRVLQIEEDAAGILEVTFDITMQKELPLDDLVLDRLVGKYVDDKDPKEVTEVFRHENQLWIKNELFGNNLQYLGSNTFTMPGSEDWGKSEIKFTLLEHGGVRSTNISVYRGKKKVKTATKSV